MRAAAVLGVGLVAAAPVMAAGCGDSYSAVFDSLPIALTRAPMGGGVAGDGALIAIAASPDRGRRSPTGCSSPPARP